MGVGMENPAKQVKDKDDMPSRYNQYDGLPAPYAAPSAAKDHMIMKQAIREAAGKEELGSVVRTDPITGGLHTHAETYVITCDRLRVSSYRDGEPSLG